MRILLYIDPLTELEKPLWKRGWINHHAKYIVEALQDAGHCAHDIALVISDALLEEAKSLFPDIQIGTLTHHDFVPGLGDNAFEVALARYQGTLHEEAINGLGKKLQRSILHFSPSIIISWSPAPELTKAWPNVPVVHWEYGMFSRAPYPETGYLDPLGMFQQSAPSIFEEQIKNWSADPAALSLLNTVRNHYRPQLFGKDNPVALALADHLSGFKRCVLLSLQFSNFYAYDAHAIYRSQYDLLIATLEATPSDVAVIVIEHPEHPLFDNATLTYLTQSYSNLVWNPVLREIYAASQYALACVDTVITVSSSVGWQAVLWGKRLIVVGSSHLNLVADTHKLTDIGIEPIHSESHEAALAWLLSRYFIPWEILFQDDRLSLRLQQIIGNYDKPVTFESFSPLAPSEDLVTAYCNGRDSALSQRIAPSPNWPGYVFTAEDVIDASLYLATDDQPFDEMYRIALRFEASGAVPMRIKVAEHLPGIRRLRLDPCEQPDYLQLNTLRFLDVNGQVLYTWDGQMAVACSNNLSILPPFNNGINGVILLSGDYDPWIEFLLPRDTYAVELAIQRPSLKLVQQAFSQYANQQAVQINGLQLSIDQHLVEINQVTEEIGRQVATISELQKSLIELAKRDQARQRSLRVALAIVNRRITYHRVTVRHWLRQQKKTKLL